MAQDTEITCAADTWTQLTDANVAADISVAVVHWGVYVLATADATAPLDTVEYGFPLPYFGNGWSEATIAEKFPGVTAPVRLWARPINRLEAPCVVRISHGA